MSGIEYYHARGLLIGELTPAEFTRMQTALSKISEQERVFCLYNHVVALKEGVKQVHVKKTPKIKKPKTHTRKRKYNLTEEQKTEILTTWKATDLKDRKHLTNKLALKYQVTYSHLHDFLRNNDPLI
jgi:hypothetical protein